MKNYYLNRDRSSNPNNNNEVHVDGCYWLSLVPLYNRVYLGFFNNGREAVAHAKKTYPYADGCKNCCPEAHKG